VYDVLLRLHRPINAAHSPIFGVPVLRTGNRGFQIIRRHVQPVRFCVGEVGYLHGPGLSAQYLVKNLIPQRLKVG